MKKLSAVVLALAATLAAAQAAPVGPRLGEPRPPVQLAALKPINNVLLFNKPVVDTSGRYIGWVENVEYQGSMILSVKVSTHRNRRASWLFSEHFKYDPKNDVVVTDASERWIQQMSFLN